MMKTPPLHLRLGETPFRATSGLAFVDAMQRLAPANRMDIHRKSLLHVSGHPYDKTWMHLAPISTQWAEAANASLNDDSPLLYGFPEYDLRLAVLRAGSPVQWFCSDEVFWMMCQATWLWGRELRLFCGSVGDSVAGDMAADAERNTGRYKLRSTSDIASN